MTFDQFSQYLSWAIYILIFCVVGAKALRRPTQANIDIALLFAVPLLTIGLSMATSLKLIQSSPVTTGLSSSLLVGLSYMLFRLVDDFSAVPPWLLRAAPAALALLVVGFFAMTPPRPQWFSSLAVLYALGLYVYTGVAFIRESQHSSGVTKRRMRAVALGSIALGTLFLLLGVLIFFPDANRSLTWLLDLVQLCVGISFFFGFATPGIIRRAWQEPELRAFLGRAASLPRLPDTESIIRELERGAASSVGAPGASIGMWDKKTNRLRFKLEDGYFDSDPTRSLNGRAFLSQKPLFSDDTQRDNPSTADLSRSRGATALLAAPITAGEKRLGVLVVYGTRAPIFAEEDLELVRLLADQAAVILESRTLIDEAARVQAREEVTRLKEDFLSAAAHDLKTPLTALVMQTELLERRALRAPQAPVDLAGLGKLKKEAYRLKELVLELLDAARAEQGKLVGEFREVDVVAIAQEVCARHSSARHACTVIADGRIAGLYDAARILQLIENLVENAVKYSPAGGPVTIRVWHEKDELSNLIDGSIPGSGTGITSDGWNRIAVTDSGIGIPREDLPNVFERFHRGSNVDDRHFAGMGLGLFICLGIVEQHGGRIWVESPATPSMRYPAGNGGHDANHEQTRQDMAGATGTTTTRSGETRPNPGTTFHVALPALPATILPQPALVGSVGEQPGRTSTD
jgi:signal transduction histidine kinase